MTKWIVGIVVVAVGGFITAQLTGVLRTAWDAARDWAFPEDPITVSVTHRPQCPWVFTAPVPDVQRALDSEHGREIDMRRAGAVDGNDSTVEITVQVKPNKRSSLTTCGRSWWTSAVAVQQKTGTICKPQAGPRSGVNPKRQAAQTPSEHRGPS